MFGCPGLGAKLVDLLHGTSMHTVLRTFDSSFLIDRKAVCSHVDMEVACT